MKNTEFVRKLYLQMINKLINDLQPGDGYYSCPLGHGT